MPETANSQVSSQILETITFALVNYGEKLNSITAAELYCFLEIKERVAFKSYLDISSLKSNHIFKLLSLKEDSIAPELEAWFHTNFHNLLPEEVVMVLFIDGDKF